MYKRNKISKITFLLLFISILIFPMSLSFSGPSHIAIRAGDFVTLVGDYTINDCSNGIGFVRVYPDGSKDTQAFRVPHGKLFILTDILIHGPLGAQASASVGVLTIENLYDSNKKYDLTINYTGAYYSSSAAEFGAGGNLTSGFVVSENAKICYSKAQNVTLNGYLVPSR